MVELLTMSPNSQTTALYNEYGKKLFGYALRLVPNSNKQHAEDVVQEVFIRLLKHLKKNKLPDEIGGFIFTTARNYITSTYYRNNRLARYNPVPNTLEEHSDNTNLERDLATKRKLIQLAECIDSLNPRPREAFIRVKIYGQSGKEAGKDMDIGCNAIHNYVLKAWNQIDAYCQEHDIQLRDG